MYPLNVQWINGGLASLAGRDPARPCTMHPQCWSVLQDRAECRLSSFPLGQCSRLRGPTFSPPVCHAVMGPDVMILVLLIFSLKLAMSLSSFTLIKRLISSLLSASLLSLSQSVMLSQAFCVFSWPWYFCPACFYWFLQHLSASTSDAHKPIWSCQSYMHFSFL